MSKCKSCILKAFVDPLIYHVQYLSGIMAPVRHLQRRRAFNVYPEMILFGDFDESMLKFKNRLFIFAMKINELPKTHNILKLVAIVR